MNDSLLTFVNSLRNKTLAERHAYFVDEANRDAIAEAFKSVPRKHLSTGVNLSLYVYRETSLRLDTHAEADHILLAIQGRSRKGRLPPGTKPHANNRNGSISLRGPNGTIVQFTRDTSSTSQRYG